MAGAPPPDENVVGGAENPPKDPKCSSKYNLLSRLFFIWVDHLFFVGCRRDLKQSDLYVNPQETDSSNLGEQFDRYWSQELARKNLNKKPRLWMVLAKSFKWPLLLQSILSLLEVAMFIAQSVILGELVDYFTEVGRDQFLQCSYDAFGLNNTTAGVSHSSTVNAYMYSLGLFLLAFGVAMIHAHYGLIGGKVGMMSRIMSTSAVYNKLLKLSQTTIRRITDGHIINVVSNDVQRLDLAFIFLPFLLIAPMHMAVFAYLAYREVGWVTFITLFLFILQIPIQLVMAKIFVKFRFKSATQTDKRVQVMNEVIGGARVVKMYGWEYAFKRVVTALRKHEIHFIRVGGLIRTMIASYNFAVSLTLFMAITFVLYERTGGELTPRRVIVVLSLLGFLRNIGASFFIRAIFLLLEGKVAITRIQEILELEEIDSGKSSLPGPASSKEMKKLKDRIPELSSESPYLPSQRTVTLTGINPLGVGAEDPDDELMPLPPLRHQMDEDDDELMPLPAIKPQNAGALDPARSLRPVTLSSLTDGSFLRSSGCVKVTDLTATWKEAVQNKGEGSEGGDKLEEADLMDTAVLKNVSFELTQEQPFLAVVGRVASGKSTLLQCLMSELRPLSGVVHVPGSLSYASQVPWVFYGTIRENILFGLAYNEERYQRVVDVCALREDLESLPDGDQTVVGERGVVLSGGQKARVNLARAMYRKADVYLLDDPLSAVDAAVGKHIFTECIQNFLEGKLVVLVTHQVQFAVSADQLLILNKGEVEAYHSREACQELGIDQHKLLEMLKDKGSEFVYDDINDDENDNVVEVDGGEENGQLGGNVLEATDIQFFATTASIGGAQTNVAKFSRFSSVPGTTVSLPPGLKLSSDAGQMRSSGFQRLASISEKSSYQYILSSRDDLSRNGGRSLSSPKRQRFQSLNRVDSFQMGPLMEPQDFTDNVSVKSAKESDTAHEGTKISNEEEKAHGTVSMKTYFKFFFAGTNVVVLLLTILVFIFGEAGIVLADTWLSKWSSCIPSSTVSSVCGTSEPICRLTDEARLGVYGGITVISIALNFLRTVMFYLICLNASKVLHNRMFAAIIRVPMRFFDINPSGRIINRFSKDIAFLDDLLPHTFLEYMFLLLKFVAILVTAAYSNVYVIIPAFFIVVIFLVFRWYYLKTSRDVKRLEAIARSPVYSHVSTTLLGLPTIRTLGMEDKAQYMLHNYQNKHTQGWYLYLVTQRWFGMRIDIVTAFYLGVVAVISVPLARTLDSGVVGLALAYTIALAGILQFCVRQSAEVENIMISTERIMEYSQLEPEASLETPPNKELPKAWPEGGGINFNKVDFNYAEGLPDVIKNLSLSIKPGEKIGIMGRTGAGKSSLISILFRLAEHRGEIVIDGINISEVGLHNLRRNMSIIPQDPVLFGGTMRYNLDPLETHTDRELWQVLEQVQLKEAVQALKGQLSGEVAEGGSNFSVGQKQLVCLARALLNDNKILILDEATANVDIGTDSIIQKTIKERFRRCTVLTIAHRLNTIMDSDKILVMSHGQKAEFDTPYNLLSNKNSLFSKMVDKTGPEASKVLRSLVKVP